MIEKSEIKKDMLEGFYLDEIQEMFDRLKNEEKSQSLESAVLIMGKTGAGKSSLIKPQFGVF